jgi:hypothetical protein
MSPTERRWLSVAQFSELYGFSTKVAAAWALSHRIPAARIGGRGPWRIDRLRLEEDLERQIKDNRPAGCLGGGAPRRLGSRPALHTRGQRERSG